MRVCVCSDVHIDILTNGVERSKDIEDAVMETVNACIDHDVKLWIFLGDWADPDNKRSFYAAMKAVEIAKILKDLDITSIWITGNHDILEDGKGSSVLSPLKASGLAIVVDSPRVINLSGNQFIFLPYSSRVNAYDPGKYLESIKDSIDPEKSIWILGHLDAKGITPGSEIIEMPRGREVFWPTETIRKLYPQALCMGGHIHKRQVYTVDDVELHIVGSLSRLTFSERNDHPGYDCDGELFYTNAAPVFEDFELGDYLHNYPGTKGFARVKIPANATDAEIAGYVELLEKSGLSVKLLPKDVAEAVVSKETVNSIKANNAREVVETLIEDGNSSDKPALKEVCNEIMDRNGV